MPTYLAQSRILADVLSEIGQWRFESGQMAGFVENTIGQIEVAANVTLAELKAMPDAIRRGRQAIPREPVPTPVAVTEPTPKTQTVFMLRSAKYHDHDGRKRFAGQWEDAAMPVATAQRALDKGIAVAVTDPRRARLRGARGGDFNPLAPDVVDLDAVEEPKGTPHIESDPVLRQAGFRQRIKPFIRDSNRSSRQDVRSGGRPQRQRVREGSVPRRVIAGQTGSVAKTLQTASHTRRRSSKATVQEAALRVAPLATSAT
jgi:hypothetical protein